MPQFHVYNSTGCLVDTIDVNVETKSEAMALYGIVHDMSSAFMLNHGWKVQFAETRTTELMTMGTPPRPMYQESGSMNDENVARRNFERFFGPGSYDNMMADKK